MRRHRLTITVPLIVACAWLGAACASPTEPAASAGVQSPLLGTAEAPSVLTAKAVGLHPQSLADRGWACRPVPSNPALTQCSPPHQGFPAIPPPEDRPATFNFLLWDGASFLGHVLLIRTDLYRGQICASTGAPYRFLALAGYYECLHPAGR